jgi:hypothetical protein
MSTYGIHTASAYKSYFDSILGMGLWNITLHSVLIIDLAKVGVMGIVCTVWWASFSHLLLI